MSTQPEALPDRDASAAPGALPGPGRAAGPRWWRVAAAVEVVLAAVTILLDLWVPTLVLLALAVCSLLVRRQGPGTLGLVRPSGRWWAAQVFGLAAAWTLVNIGLVIPVLEHLSGQRRDVSQFSVVQGNLGTLAVLLAFSWTLAAVGEEVAYRGLLITRLQDLLQPVGTRTATLLATVVAALLFGWAHSEQGLVGIATTAVDALFFSCVRFRYRSLWAAVLAHGFLNSIGLVTYFFVGPVHGLW